jgi:proline iminopeptidase
MVELYPPIDPYDHGLLAVGDGNFKRGCGRSTPHASDPTTDMAFNTTEHLISDIEALRAHLGIDRWLVSGGSWGCTLALAYAERHPHRTTQIVLTSVTTSRRVEADWLYRGVARFFPEAWERFRNHVSEAARDEDVVTSYARRMEHPDADVRLAAARAWCAWEDAVVSLEPSAHESSHADRAPRDMVAFVRICTHYLRHGAWLEEGALIRDAGKLAGIPGVLIHGRRDLSCPVDTACALARAWPGAELVVLADAGHLRTDSKRRALLRALDTFARC